MEQPVLGAQKGATNCLRKYNEKKICNALSRVPNVWNAACTIISYIPYMSAICFVCPLSLYSDLGFAP